MNKHVIIWVFLISTILCLSTAASAVTLTILNATEFAAVREMKNTTIDYVSYKELVANEAGVVYPIKIINTGTREKDYEIIPDSVVIKSIGTYRIDPSDKITLKSGQQETIYLYLAVEKPVASRTVIPVKIKSGVTETTLELVARTISLTQKQEQRTGTITAVFKIILAIFLAIIILLAIIFAFRKRKQKEEETEEELKPEFDENVETYY